MVYLEAELDLCRSHAASQVRGMALLGAELEELRSSARGRATRIRLAALSEAAEVSAAVGELGDGGPTERLFAALERAIERVASEVGEGEELDGEEGDGEDVDREEAGDPVASAAAERSTDGAAERVSVDIGPFSDFSQLVGFEDAANSIGETGEISIRRFSRGRASIDVDLDEPVDLLRALEESSELEFRVRESSPDEIILDLDD